MIQTETKDQELHAIRGRICEGTLIALAISAIPVLPISLARGWEFSWQWDLGLQVLFAIVLWSITIFRTRVPFVIKAWYPIAAIFFIAVSTQVVRGLIGSPEYLYLGAIVLTFAIHGWRAAVILCGFSLVISMIAGAAFVGGLLQPLPDQEIIARSFSSWSTRIGAFAFVLVLVIAALGVLDRDLRGLMARLVESRDKLATHEAELEAMVVRRTGNLTESEHRLRRILESTSDGFIMVDTDFMITDVNPALEIVVRQPRKALLGQSLLTLVPGVDPEELRRRFFGEDSGSGFETSLTLPTNERVDCLLHPTPYHDSKGVLNGAFAMVIDVSQIKESARELRHALGQARAGEQAKNKFISMMSHEVRTPLNAIIGMSQLLLRGDMDSTQRGFAETILQAGETLLATINNILDFSKLDEDSLELDLLPFRVGSAVEATTRDYADQASRKGLLLEVSLAPELPEVAIGDETRLRQILANLVNNGIKFTTAGSVRIAVTLGPVENDRAQIQIRVSDTGIGMDEATRAKLFKTFSQSEDNANRRFEGTGMGLAITRGLVSAMGGTIDVESTPDQGSVFTVVVPLGVPEGWVPPASATPPKRAEQTGAKPEAPHNAPRDSGEEPDTRPDEASTPGLRILVATSDSAMGSEADRTLGDRGHMPTLVADGATMLQMLNDQTFDLVVVDGQLPDMDGLRAGGEIRRLPGRLSRIPIVLIAGGRGGFDPQILKALSINGQLKKPVQWDELDRLARDLGQQMGVL